MTMRVLQTVWYRPSRRRGWEEAVNVRNNLTSSLRYHDGEDHMVTVPAISGPSIVVLSIAALTAGVVKEVSSIFIEICVTGDGCPK